MKLSSFRLFFCCVQLSYGLLFGACAPDARDNSQNDGGEAAQNDGGEAAQNDGGEAAQNDGGEAAQNDGGEAAQNDGGEAAQNDGGAGFTEPAGLEGVVAAHNRVRAAAEPTPVPALPDLVWSQSAADVAQAWAAQCKWGHNPNRGAFGENIAVWSGTSQGSGVAGTEMWGAEMSIYDLESNSCSGSACGHYTQIVWRNTVSVGCALQVCDVMEGLENFGQSQFLVCNYAPPGNYVGQRPY